MGAEVTYFVKALVLYEVLIPIEAVTSSEAEEKVLAMDGIQGVKEVLTEMEAKDRIDELIDIVENGNS